MYAASNTRTYTFQIYRIVFQPRILCPFSRRLYLTENLIGIDFLTSGTNYLSNLALNWVFIWGKYILWNNWETRFYTCVVAWRNFQYKWIIQLCFIHKIQRQSQQEWNFFYQLLSNIPAIVCLLRKLMDRKGWCSPCMTMIIQMLRTSFSPAWLSRCRAQLVFSTKNIRTHLNWQLSFLGDLAPVNEHAY